MKTKTNHSVFFKTMVLVLAFALAVLCAPLDALVALAQMSSYTDYSYMTIGKLNDEVKTTVTKGQRYTITEAYIGSGKNFAVGSVAEGTELASGVTAGKSGVTVKYATQDITDSVTLDADTTNTVYGSFVADKIGTYTITYSYEYVLNAGTPEEKTYTNKYELKVNSELDGASVSFESNEQDFIPSVIDLAQLTEVKSGETVTGYKDVKGNEKKFALPTATITDEDGEEIPVEELTYVTSKSAMTATGKYVLVTVTGGQNAGEVALTVDNGKIYIPMSVFAEEDFGAGNYTIRYALYEKTAESTEAYVVTSSTKSFSVYADADNAADDYYAGEEYKLKLELASSWSDNGQTGVETSLPAAKGVTAKETVDVYYKVQVLHSTTGASKSWSKLDASKYNVAGEDAVIDSDSYLIDPASFKPLEDGYYTFLYTITDFYGNTVTTTEGTYEWTEVVDEQAPTPVIYDASQAEVVDETYKLQSRSVPNGVVVYAIGIDDNVSTAATEGVELSRKIMTSDTVTKLTITKYNDKNLVFNYRNTNNSDNAYANLLANNAVLAKNVAKSGETIANDTDMLTWLAENNYMIVVDDANAETIYNIFNTKADGEADVFASVTTETDATARKEAVLAWLKSDDSASKGFAYVGGSETFGATTGENGMGAGSYTIRYIAVDAAGNEKEISKSMYVGTYDDNSYPEIKFSTTLADTYLPGSEITFNAPTVSDNYDTNMLVKTMYRYLDNEGKIVTKDVDNKAFETTTLAELKADLNANAQVSIDENGTLLTEKYSKFFTSADVAEAGQTIDNAAGYIDLTEKNASTYTIDLSEVGENAVKLQIVTYVYDDCGNANLYAEEIAIANATDNAPPTFNSIDTEETSFIKNYVQGEEIELPAFTVLDDAVSYMSYDVKLYHVDSKGNETAITTYDAYTERDIRNSTGAGSYTVHGGKFVASFAGTYKASIAVKDSKNKTVVSFVEYEVASRNVVQPPVISTSLESKTVELDESPVISIPTPSVSYDIPNSVTYDQKDTTEGANAQYVVIGADQNGKATNWSTTHGQAQSFKPTEIGEYNIQYTVKLTVYNRNVFTYQEMGGYDEVSDSYVEGGYFTTAALAGNFELVDANTVKLTGSDDTYEIVKDSETGLISITNSNGFSVGAGSEYDVDFSSVATFTNITSADELNFLFEDLKLYVLESETYTIIAKDSTGPVIAEYDYASSMSKEELAQGIKIYGIEATDLGTGINAEKSKIVVSWKLANGESGTETYSNTENKNMTGATFTKESSSKNYDGTYKITYTVYDNNNNYSTKEYSIAVGDNVAPTVTIKEDVLVDQYEIDSQIKINLSDITVKDNKELTNPTKTVTLKNTSTDKVIENIGTETELVYDLTEVGSYTLTIEVEDAVGNTTTETYEFEVVAKTKDATKTYQVVGTVLIVLSVVILAGVIVYFVVSKVKLDKELKK